MVLILMGNIFKIKNNFQDISVSKTYSGEGIINNDQAKGIILRV